MLTIDIKLNGRRIAGARISNLSDLEDISDYQVESREDEFPDAGLPEGRADFILRAQPRNRSVWWLISKVAKRAAAIREQNLGEIFRES